jgi:integrase/recombinase XerD
MVEDMTARGLGQLTQRGHIRACKRFAAYLKRSPETATAEDVRLFQLHLMESGLTIQNRNRTMTGVRFLLRVTMRRLDLAAEIFHMKEPVKIPQILSAEEAKRLLLMAGKPQVRMLFSIGYGAGLRCDGQRRLGRRLEQDIVDDGLVGVGEVGDRAPIASGSAPGSASPRCCTPGDRR